MTAWKTIRIDFTQVAIALTHNMNTINIMIAIKREYTDSLKY